MTLKAIFGFDHRCGNYRADLSIKFRRFAGYVIAGIPGRHYVTIRRTIPSFCICLILVYFYYKYRNVSGVQVVLGAMRSGGSRTDRICRSFHFNAGIVLGRIAECCAWRYSFCGIGNFCRSVTHYHESIQRCGCNGFGEWYYRYINIIY